MPNYRTWNKCSLDEAFTYFDNYYKYAINSKKKSKIYDFNIALLRFIEPKFSKEKIMDLKTYNYTIKVIVSRSSYKFSSFYRFDIYRNSKEEPTLLTVQQINKLKRILAYLETDTIKKDYKKANITGTIILIGFVLFVVSLMSISIYLN